MAGRGDVSLSPRRHRVLFVGGSPDTADMTDARAAVVPTRLYGDALLDFVSTVREPCLLVASIGSGYLHVMEHANELVAHQFELPDVLPHGWLVLMNGMRRYDGDDRVAALTGGRLTVEDQRHLLVMEAVAVLFE